MREAPILQAIRIALGRLPDLRLWRNECGVAKHAGRFVRYGLVRGSADLVGILGPAGRLFALEVKAPGGKLTNEQAAWLALVRRFGGFGCVAHSVDEAVSAYQRARNGGSE